jgi:hypothetical protein
MNFSLAPLGAAGLAAAVAVPCEYVARPISQFFQEIAGNGATVGFFYREFRPTNMLLIS